MKYADPNIDLIDKPSIQSMEFGYRKLYNLGFVDHNCNPTAIGYYALKIFKLPLECIRMIFAGYSNDVNIIDLITIASLITVKLQSLYDKPKFEKKFNKNKNMNKNKENQDKNKENQDKKPHIIGGENSNDEEKHPKTCDESDSCVSKSDVEQDSESDSDVEQDSGSDSGSKSDSNLEIKTQKKIDFNEKRTNFSKKNKFDKKKPYTTVQENLEQCDVLHMLHLYKTYLELLKDNYKDIKLMEKIEKWCKENKINHNGFVEVTILKESVVENFLINGLNPYANSKNAYDKKAADVEYETAIKQCVYDGYMYYTLKKNNSSIHDQKTYKWKGFDIKLDFTGSNYVVATGITMRNINNKYTLSSDFYCNVDTINVDERAFT
jgi:HrpA-like RNA helicase